MQYGNVIGLLKRLVLTSLCNRTITINVILPVEQNGGRGGGGGGELVINLIISSCRTSLLHTFVISVQFGY